MRSTIGHDYYGFEDLVRQVLEAGGLSARPTPRTRDSGVDLFVAVKEVTWAIQIRFYRSPRSPAGLLLQASKQLAYSRELVGATALALIVSSEVPPQIRERLARELGIAVADRTDLLRWASAHLPTAVDRLSALMSLEPGDLVDVEGPSLSEFFGGPAGFPVPQPEPPPDDGHLLCEEIRGIQAGRSAWRVYEEVCERALRFLFEDSLLLWSSQTTTEDGLNRVDLICRLTPTREFWQFALNHLNSRYVVFEFKNCDGPIQQGQILTTEKYLFQRGLRSIAIVVTREGATDQAMRMVRGAMRESGKLMLVVNDEDMCEMLHMRDRGEDPTDYLFALTDQLLITLGR